jgi:hypothetical protein
MDSNPLRSYTLMLSIRRFTIVGIWAGIVMLLMS